jgi:hypothetical protein
MSDEHVTTSNFVAHFEQSGDLSYGSVYTRSEFENGYQSTPEWTIRDKDKERVVEETIEALLWYERNATV